jgi:peptidoglycan LD-endopeptidase CwlK
VWRGQRSWNGVAILAKNANPRRGHLPDGVASNGLILSKLSRDRLQGVHADLVRVVERAIQITTQDFRVQEGLRTRERQAALVARGASRTMNSRTLTGHAVDLVALDGGEVSWQWENYFRVAAMQAAAREFGAPVRWGGCWHSLFAIASPEDSVADCVAACHNRPESRSWTARTSSCRGPAGMIDWIKTAQGGTAA